MRRWSTNANSDNFKVRSEAIKYANLDLIGVAETNLGKSEFISLENYEWFGHIRSNLYRNVWKGSGGVGFLVKKDLLSYFKIEILDSSTEGILWINLKDSIDTSGDPYSFSACVCYLPPQGSSRNIDPHNFFDSLLFQIHVYGKDSNFFLCGDYNARCADYEDFIAGIDDIPDRDITDFTSNQYGQILCEFLMDANCCILNGRGNYIQNNCTFISPNAGSSVIDYCLVPYESLASFDNFNILKMSELLNNTGYYKEIDSTTCGSDHSLLTWTLN